MDPTPDEYRGLYVLVDAPAGRLSDSSARLLGVARTLADSSGALVTALLPSDAPIDGSEAGDAGTAAIAHGADTVLLLSDARLASGNAPALAAAVAAVAATRKPAVILLADSPTAREVAPRLARRLGTGLVSAVEAGGLDLDTGSNTLPATRREWSGRLLTTYAQPSAHPQIVTVRVAGTARPYADDWRSGSTESADISAVQWPDPALTPQPVTNPQSAIRNPQSDESPVVAVARQLRAARCLVVGGRGVGSAAGFARVQQLAAALGGEWAATGGAVEAGFALPEREVSLYGTSVQPEVYIGCGVSGSPQHVVAMQQARTIVAVNSDPNAPIFRWAHYAIVADSTALLDGLLARLGSA
ncbi:MAG: electron transfer flavoprotein subunit alpha/FixB family protein [Chloroflexota bacterium]|nr:electron transfer flavoprotein subunit alpha/FixB family protein [Chloroflexota bacterium]